MERKNLPNATVSLVLGILSILTCLCYGVLGLPLGIVAFFLGNKALKINATDPDNFKGAGSAKAGKITGIIGIILNLVFLLAIVWLINKIGWDAFQDQEVMQERVNELFGV
ncbi:CCC motif membrane protein [Polaribacter sp. M15]